MTSAGQVWMDRNLGASRVALTYDDAAAHGDLYQWGRGADGHQNLNSAVTTVMSSTDDPGHGDFILRDTFEDPYDWRSPQNDNLWQGVTGINNPCPSGFRIPTLIEIETEMASWTGIGLLGAIESPLRLTAAGIRHRATGAAEMASEMGRYHTSTVLGSNSEAMFFRDGQSYTGAGHRSFGASVRCIKD